MADYRVWEPDLDNETEVIVGAGKWASYEADSADEAARDLALEMSDSGNFPDHFSDDAQEFDIHVRDLDTSKLYAITIHWDWEPIPYAAKARELVGEEDELTHSVAQSYGMDKTNV